MNSMPELNGTFGMIEKASQLNPGRWKVRMGDGSSYDLQEKNMSVMPKSDTIGPG